MLIKSSQNKSTSIFLCWHILMVFGGDLGSLIFHVQWIIEWSLKQSDMTPDLIILLGWETNIQSIKVLDFLLTRVGLFIICVRLISWNFLFTESDDLWSQFRFTSPNKINSFRFGIDVIVAISWSNDFAGEEGGLYMLPMCRDLFVWKTILTKTDSKSCGSAEGTINSDAISAET